MSIHVFALIDRINFEQKQAKVKKIKEANRKLRFQQLVKFKLEQSKSN